MDQLVILSRLEQEYLLRIIESAAQVRDVRQFFLWSQGQLQSLLPHQLMVCMQFDPDGALQRLEALHASVMDEALLARLCDPQTGLALRLARHCSTVEALPCIMEVQGAAPGAALAPLLGELAGCGYDNVLAHGSGPVAGGATVFVLFGLPMRPGARHAYFLSLLLPHLHLQLLQLARPVPQRGSARRATPAASRALSARELQIVHCLREGKRNDEIGLILGISALTVKNHLQRIYKVLEVRNRTEAVARCLAMRVPPGPAPSGLSTA